MLVIFCKAERNIVTPVVPSADVLPARAELGAKSSARCPTWVTGDRGLGSLASERESYQEARLGFKPKHCSVGCADPKQPLIAVPQACALWSVFLQHQAGEVAEAPGMWLLQTRGT